MFHPSFKCIKLHLTAVESWCPLYIHYFSFFYFLIVFYFIFNFTILYWFCHISTWIRPRYTRVPHPEPSSHLPPHTIPLGHPSAPAPSFLYPASNLEWQFISYIILYMFQCHSPKSSPLLPQSPKDCSINSIFMSTNLIFDSKHLNLQYLQQ